MGKTSVFGEFAEFVRKWAKKVGEANVSLPMFVKQDGDPARLSEATLAKMSDDQKKLANALLRGDAAALSAVFAKRPEAATEKFPKGPASLLAVGRSPMADGLVSGRTPLMIAAARNQPEALRAVLARPELDVNERDEDGRAALAHAAEASPECVALLLADKRCDASVQDIHGDTALVWAASFAQPDSVRRLARRATPEDGERAFRRALEETEIIVRAQGASAAAAGWACLDELSEFAHEIDAEDAVRLAAGKTRQRMPQHAARLEARELQAEVAGRRAASAKKAAKGAAEATGRGAARRPSSESDSGQSAGDDLDALSETLPGKRRSAL